MRALGRDAALGRHARVAEPVRALDVAEGEALDELARPPDLLVDLDHTAGAHHAQVGPVPAQPALGLVGIRLDVQHRVLRPRRGVLHAAECAGELAAERVPILTGIGAVQGELAPARRRRMAVDGDARAVRPAVAHLLEHGREVPAELRLELRRLAEQSDDPAHAAG